MRIKAGTLAVDITADGSSFESTLKRADTLSDAFADTVDRRMKRVGKGLQALGESAGMTDKEIAGLEKRMRDGLAADSASRALENLRRYAGLTAAEYQNLAAKMGIATREGDKSATSFASLAKQVAVAAAAYVSLREAVQLMGGAFGQFMDYESALTDMGRVTSDSLESVDATIKALPREMGDPTSMMQAYYQVLSSGATDSAQAMDLLTTSAKASKAAHLAQSETVKALTKLLAGFDGEIRSAAEASDLLFRIDNLGQTSFAELVPVIGDVAEVTHLVGVSSQEMAAGLALITQTSGSTAEAATKWKAIMVGLYKPTENMEKVLKALGYTSGEAMVQQEGFAGAIRKLQGVAEKSGFSLGKLFESSEALTGIAGLSAQEWARFTDTLEGVRQGSDETEKTWQRWLTTSQAVKDTFDATLKQMGIEFGEQIAPMLIDAMKRFQDEMARPEGKAAMLSLAEGAATLGENLLHDAVPALAATVQGINDFVAAWSKIPAPLQGALLGGGMAALLSRGNPWVTGGGALLGMMSFGDAANDRSVAEGLARAAKESRTRQLLEGDNTGTIPELAQMFPGDLPARAEKARKAVDGVKVALKNTGKEAENAANAAARYTERSEAYFDQVRYTIDSLSDVLSGGLEGETLKVDKTFERIFADIRKSVIGAKGDTEGFKQAWVEAEKAWPLLRMTAQVKDFEKELDKAAKYARDMGTFLSDPKQLEAADWLEGYKQYVQDLREARLGTDQEDAEAIARAQARWDAYQEHVLQAQRERLGEGGKLAAAYWESEEQALQKHLAAVKENIEDETAYKIYEAQRWDEFLKAQLEQQTKYAGTFGETLAAKWSLAFGGYESETTKAKKRWDSMSDGIIEATDGMIDGVSGGLGDLIRNIGNGTASIEDLWKNMLARMLDAFASFVEKLVKQQLEDLVGGLFSGSGSGAGGGLSLPSLTGSHASSGSLGDGIASLKTLGDYLGKSAGASIGDYFTTAASSGQTLFMGGGNALADIFSEGIDMSALAAQSTTFNAIGVEAMASTYGAAETAAMSATSLSSVLGTAIPVVGALVGVGGLLAGLFGQTKEEVRKTASGYNVSYAGGKTAVSGVDFYSDGSVVGTGVSDPAVTRQISEAFRDAAERIDDAAENLGFAVDNLIENFKMPSMNITEDQLGTYIDAGTNLLAFQALEQAGLRGAFDALADDGQTYIDQIQEFSDAFGTVVGGLSAYGYEIRDVAQITQGQIDDLRARTIETAQGTSQAILTMAQSMGATSDQLAELAANASDGSQALAVTDEQLQNLLAADYAEELLRAVGGEDAFASIMSNLTSHMFDTVDAYVENLGYYADKAGESIARLGDGTVTIDNFWAKFDAALKSGLTVDEFEAWGKASQWVQNFDSITEAIADWGDAMTQYAQGLDIRMLKAQGLDYEAEITQMATDAEWELAQAREAGYDAALIARLQEVQAAEMAARIAEHQLQYAEKLRDANKRYATAVGDSAALVAIAIEENAAELQELTKSFDWSPGSADEPLFQELQAAQTMEIIAMVREYGDALIDATEAMERDLAARKATIAGYDEEAEALQMVAGFADELTQAYEDGLDPDLITELMQVQMDELAKYWADTIDEMQSNLEDLYRTQADLLDSLSGNTKSAIEELYSLFARYQAGETDLRDDIIDSLSAIADAIDSMVQDIYDTIYEIRTGSEYTTDDAATVAANSRAYFDEQYALAASGDTTAMGNITNYAKDYLSSLRTSTADQSVYESGVDYVTSRLSSLASGATGTSSGLKDIAQTVTDDEIAEAEAALKCAQVAQLETVYETLMAQAVAAFQGSEYGSLVSKLAATGLGWEGAVAHLNDSDNWDGANTGARAADRLISHPSELARYYQYFLSAYGAGTGYVDWDEALSKWVSQSASRWPGLDALPGDVGDIYAQAQTAYTNWQDLKSQYGFATGGMIEGGIPGEDSVWVLGKPGEAVLTERETDLIRLLAGQLQGVSLAGARGGRDDVVAEVVELRREVSGLRGELRETQQKLVDATKAIASMLAQCGMKEGALQVTT